MQTALKPPNRPIRFRHSGALLNAVMENAAVGMVLVANDGRITYANPAFGQIVRYAPEEWLGRRLIELVHPDDLDEARDAFNAFAAGAIGAYQAERRYLRSDGSAVWVLASPSLLVDERSGRTLYTIVQITDIDQRKRAEDAMAAAEQRWNAALESAGQGVWDHDLVSGRVFVSRMWRQMRGLDPDGGTHPRTEEWIVRVHPDDLAMVMRCEEEQKAGRLDSYEYRERHEDGRWIWILSRGRPVAWNADGSPARVLGTDTDITSLKAVEAELASEKEMLSVTLQSIGDGVISTDAERRVTFMNPAAEQMTGWSAAEAAGRPVEAVFAVVDAATGDPVEAPVRECLARRRPCVIGKDVVLVGRGGERRDIRDSAAPLRKPDGSVLGAVLVFQDITDSRALQRELAHSAMHDGLTGLPNRSAFERALEEARRQASEERRAHALCFVDLDRFKAVNDSAGHAAGDALLQQIGATIRQACRKADFAARIGGDEFALLLADTTLPAAEAIARGLIAALGALRFTWKGAAHDVGASIGITAVTGRSQSAAELMAEADIACYAAKAGGRNGVSVYDPGRLARRG